MAPSQFAHDVISIVKEVTNLDWMVSTWTNKDGIEYTGRIKYRVHQYSKTWERANERGAVRETEREQGRKHRERRKSIESHASTRRLDQVGTDRVETEKKGEVDWLVGWAGGWWSIAKRNERRSRRRGGRRRRRRCRR